MVGKWGWKTLWLNPDYSKNFAPQTITWSDMHTTASGVFLIEYLYSVGTGIRYYSICIYGTFISLQIGANTYINRQVYINSSGIQFYDCINNTGSTAPIANQYAIPNTIIRIF